MDLSLDQVPSARRRAQASFFDGIMFLLIVVFSITLVFVSLGSYTAAEDKALRSSYLINYLQSTTKVLYYLDANSLKDVKPYCADLGSDAAGHPYSNSRYCLPDGTDRVPLDCRVLGLTASQYPNQVSVIDLLKKDVSSTKAGANAEDYLHTFGNLARSILDSNNREIEPAFQSGTYLDDKYGSSTQYGRMAMRCAMKELMKPFTFSAYHYQAEVTYPFQLGGTLQENPILPDLQPDDATPGTPAKDLGYISDLMYYPDFEAFGKTDRDQVVKEFSCQKVDSSQLLVLRSPFKLVLGTSANGAAGPRSARNGYEEKNLALRICLWPAET